MVLDGRRELIKRNVLFVGVDLPHIFGRPTLQPGITPVSLKPGMFDRPCLR